MRQASVKAVYDEKATAKKVEEVQKQGKHKVFFRCYKDENDDRQDEGDYHLKCFSFNNTLRPRQNGSHFVDNIFRCISLNNKAFRERQHPSAPRSVNE